MGKKSKKQLSIFIWIICCTPETNKTLKISYTSMLKNSSFQRAALDDYSNTFSKAIIPGSGVGADLLQA